MVAQALMHIGIEQGLPQGFVTHLMQDREGFIWMGSPGTGLNRFDGHRFLNFMTNPFDPNSITGGNVYSITDLGDYLFVGTLGEGANLYHKKTGRFFHLPFLDQRYGLNLKIKNKLPASTSALLAKTKDGTLWIRSHHHSIDVFVLSRVKFPRGFWENLAFSTPKDQHKWLSQMEVSNWRMDNVFSAPLENGETLCRMDADKLVAWEKNTWKPLPVPRGLLQRPFFQISEAIATQVDYWQTADGEIWRSSSKGSHWKKVGKAPKGIDVIQFTQNFALIRNGNRYEAFPLQWSPFFINWSKPKWTVDTKEERYIQLIDSSGNLWLANRELGLLKFSPISPAFNTLSTEKSAFLYPLLHNGWGKLSCHNLSNRGLTIIGSPKKLVDFVQTICDGDKDQLSLAKSDHQHTLWLGGKGHLVWLDLVKQTSKSFRLPYPYPIEHPANEFFLEPDGSIQAPIRGVLVHLHPASDSATALDFRQLGLSDLRIYAVEKTADQSFWLATEKGLLRIFPKSKTRIRTDSLWVSSLAQARSLPVFKARTKLYQPNPNNRNSLNNKFVLSLLADPKDPYVLWIGTRGGGINRLDLRSNQFVHLNTANGLPDNVIYGILSDQSGNLWLSSNKGLIVYHPQSGKIKNYRKVDGLQDDEFNTASFAKDSRGFFYFGGVRGMNVFHPATIKENPHRPKVRLTGLKINDKVVNVGDGTGILKEAIDHCHTITLPHHQNTVTLEFAALEFTASSKNQYRYWLKGLEGKKESHLSHVPQITYFSIPPGKYTFFVHGANNDGVWSEEPASIQICILPPWYKHWLAYLSYVAVCCALLGWFWKQYKNKQKLKFNLAMAQKEFEFQNEIHRYELMDIGKKLELERQEAEHEQKIYQLKLQEITTRLLEKTQILQNIQMQKTLHEGNDVKGQLLRSSILTREDWELFQENFSNAYPHFVERLMERFPAVTPSELRLILLMKLNLDTPRIATILGISPDSVKKTRHRLRKKLQDQEISLEDMLKEQ